MKQIIFAGGVHGVGKSTLFREAAAALSLAYLSASEVLKWGELNEDPKNKNVIDVPDTQRRLIDGLNSIVRPNQIYLLDGHYCLFNQYGDVTQVPINTFEQINPVILVLITGAISDIKNALEKRDNRSYDKMLLSALQEKEITHAQIVAKHLNTPLLHFEQQKTTLDQLIAQINESLT